MREDKTARIRELNDQLRTSLHPRFGRIVATAGVLGLDDAFWGKCLETVRRFADFSKENDPYGEHDFGKITIDGTDVFWKIDCFQKGSDYAAGAEDPSDASATDRVMTIMLATEY